MRSLKFSLLVVVAIAGLALGTGVSASTGQEFASGSGARLHVRDLMLKGGAHAYVRMPDRIKRIVRTADLPAFSCPGAIASSKVNTVTAQSCTWPTNYAGPVTCLQVSTSPNVTQTCDVSQMNTSLNNTALIVQIIWSQNPSADQDGTQIVRLRQTNVRGANNASVSQYIKQSKGPGTPDDTEEDNAEPAAQPTMSATQTQESHQTVHLRQITSGPTAGSNNAAVLQFLRQRARISDAAAVNQAQNTALRPTSCVKEPGSDNLGPEVIVDPNANQCILSNQTSSNGPLNLILSADYDQFQRASKATSGSQTQGVPLTGGGDIGLTQLSTGLAKIVTVQNERQTQRAIDANVFQSQNGPRKGDGSSQGTNPADTWNGSQSSTQVQTSTTTAPTLATVSAGNQTNLLRYFGDSTGDIRAAQTVNQNGVITNFGCPKPGIPIEGPNHTCRAEVICEPPEGGGDAGVSQTGSICTPNCPEGTRFNPKTQQCEAICGEGCPTTIESPITSTPLYSYRR